MAAKKKQIKYKMVDIEWLKEWDENPRDNDAAAEQLAALIEEFGFIDPIICTPDGTIRAGHTRKKAARIAGLKKVPVVVVEFASEEHAQAYSLADNASQEWAKWDEKKLASVVLALKKSDALPDLAITGFQENELAGLLRRADERELASLRDDSYSGLITGAVETDIQPGDLFDLGGHRLLCGDATVPAEVQRVMGGPKVRADLMVADPPYCSGGFQESGKHKGSKGTDAKYELLVNDTLSTRGYRSLMKQAITAAPVGVIYIFTDWRMWVNLFDIVESCGYGVRSMIVWDKEFPGMGVGWRMQHELVMCGSMIKNPFQRKGNQGNVIQCKRTGNPNHPTEKPVDLLGLLIKTTAKHKTVLDPFAGGGSTAIACEKAGVRCYLMEITPKYCQITINRWEKFTGKKALKIKE